MTSENSTRKQSGRPFRKGQSGNPKGKPKGTLNHATRAVMALLDGEAEALTRKAVEMALSGDATALRLCLERLAPPRKDAPLAFEVPAMTCAGDATKALGGILKAVGDGGMTPSEGAAVAALIENYRKTLETSDLEARIAALEENRS